MSETPRPAIDRVALAGALIALFGSVVLPFAEVRPNRLLTGELFRVWSSAGWVGWLLIAAAALGVAAAALPVQRRALAVLASGVATFSAWVFAAGASAANLMPPGDTPVRVSIAWGAWLVLVGVAVVWFEGQRATGSRAATLVAAGVALAAVVGAWAFGGLSQLSLAYEYRANSDIFWALTASHVLLAVGGASIAAVIGIPLGIAASRTRLVRASVIPASGVIQTVPSLALYGLLIIPLGLLGLPTLGALPALIALTLYALLPIVRNTYLGISGVDPAIIDAGRGMGMAAGELLWRVELPLAMPLLLEGVRAALVMTVGVTAVMAIAGARNLGTLVFLGWGSTAVDLVLLGAVPMVVLSIIADQGVRAIGRGAISPGIRIREGQE